MAKRAKVFDNSGSLTEEWIEFPAGGKTGVTTDGTQTLTNKTLTSPTVNTPTVTVLDNAWTVQDNADATKQAKFECSGITAGQTRTMTIPDASTTLVGHDTTQTLTNKTLTAPVLGGSVTGTYTLAGTPTITAPTITSPTITGVNASELKRCSAQVDATSSTTLADVTGLTGFTLTASGVYVFEAYLQTTCSTNGGIAIAFQYNTATLTSIQLDALTIAAASVAFARSTTATDQTKFINSKTAAWLECVLRGTLVVNAGGTLDIQMAQETSHADTSSVYVGSWARFTRIA